MNTTRTGKIARLPRKIREQLNCRLRDGEEGVRLVAWLKALPVVQEILKEQFGGRAVNEQNLSDWRQGGFAEWQRHQEAREATQGLVERARDLTCDINPDEESDYLFQTAGDQLAVVLGVELARQAQTALAEAASPDERWQRLRELLKLTGELRRDDHRQARLFMEAHEWKKQQAREAQESIESELSQDKNRILAPIMAALQSKAWAGLFGDGPEARVIANFIVAVKHDLQGKRI